MKKVRVTALLLVLCLAGGAVAEDTAWASESAEAESVQPGAYTEDQPELSAEAVLAADVETTAESGTTETDSETASETATAAETTSAESTESGETSTAETQTVREKTVTNKGILLGRYLKLPKTTWLLATAKSYTRVFRSRSTSSRVLGSFTKNNCIVVDRSKVKKNIRYRWIPVKMPGGRTGYVKFTQIRLGWLNTKNFGLNLSIAKNRTRAKICRYPLKYLGTKFLLGGSSFTNGIDCSTMIRRTLRRYGVYVPSNATARVLSGCGKKIRRSQLKPGDLLFYYQSYTERYIAHSAIYIGRGYIVSASGHQGHYYPSGGIRISRIDYRYPTAVRFRNVVGN